MQFSERYLGKTDWQSECTHAYIQKDQISRTPIIDAMDKEMSHQTSHRPEVHEPWH